MLFGERKRLAKSTIGLKYSLKSKNAILFARWHFYLYIRLFFSVCCFSQNALAERKSHCSFMLQATVSSKSAKHPDNKNECVITDLTEIK